MNIAIQPTLSAIHAPSLVEHVYRNYVAVLFPDIVAGARLVELDVAAQMPISQGSAREALGRLEREVWSNGANAEEHSSPRYPATNARDFRATCLLWNDSRLIASWADARWQTQRARGGMLKHA